VAVFKQAQRVVAWEKQPQREMSFKLLVYKFSNLLIKNTCNVGLMKNNGEARLSLQELLECHTELHFIFFERHLHFYRRCTSYNGSLQITAYFQTLSMRLTEEIENLSAHHVPR